jgi:hypothetical protein
MAYKFRKGDAELSGAMTTDDIAYFYDTDTKIDWDSDYISFQTAGNDVLVVSGSKVGIGTATPTTTLHVSSSDNASSFRVDNLQSTTKGPALFVTGARGDGAAVQCLGIGTDTPAQALDVNGYITIGASGGAYVLVNDDSDTYIRFGHAGSDSMQFKAGGLNFLEFDENGLDIARINPDGVDIDFQVATLNNDYTIFTEGSTDRVGIGTSSPAAVFSVSGSEFDGLAIDVADDNTTYFQISGSEQGSVTAFGSTAANAATNNPDTSFFISGTVGGKGNYGVTVINGDLQVSGNIYNTLGNGETTHFSPYLAQQILDPSSYALFSITNSSDTLYKVDWDTGDTSCTDPHVTFTAPPSGKVLVDVHAYIDDTSTSGGGPYVYLALSTSTAANIGSSDVSLVGKEKIVMRPDEEDDGVRTLTFYASGLTAGTSYTWNLFARRWNDGDANRIICGAQYAAMIMQVRPIMDNADIYSS